VLPHEAAVRGAARASQKIDRGVQAVARGGACCASQVLDHGAHVDARDAEMLPHQENNNSVDVQRSIVNITGFICTVARLPLRRLALNEFESVVEPLRRRWRIFQPLLCCLRIRHKISVRTSGGPIGGKHVAECWGDGPHCPCAARYAVVRRWGWECFIFKGTEGGATAGSQPARGTKFLFGLAAIHAVFPLKCSVFIVNSEPHTGASPSVRVYVELKKHAGDFFFLI
jgi:hypothetical protein